jgi:cytochrome c5
MSVQVTLGKFLSPVDVYMAYGSAADPDKIYIMKADYTVQAYSLSEISNAIYSGGALPAGLGPWKQGITGPINEILLNGIPVSQIPSGDYALYLMTTPAGSMASSSIWGTTFSGTGPDGAALYSQNCAGCHGTLASSAKRGRTAAQVRAAIGGNTGGMGFMSGLSDFQLQIISSALSQATPPPMPLFVPTADGTKLYAQNCAACNGTPNVAFPAGISSGQVQTAINSVPAMTGLGFLMPDQVAAITNKMMQGTGPAPAPAPVPADGTTLYGLYCAGCHGALSASAKTGRTASQIQAISTALASSTPTPTPSGHPSGRREVHGDYVEKNGTVSCTSCHGADLRGGSGPSCYSCHGKRW